MSSLSLCLAFSLGLQGPLLATPVSKLGASRTLHSAEMNAATLAAPVGGRSALDAEPAVHPAFELVKTEMVDEYTIKAATYRHRKSGAEIISAQADDDNKVFGIVFRTPVSDSTGVPHILEHSVLCGSRKYTSKEPFAELLKGSLQTFLNAFTYPDRTCYPIASQNTKDFYNLANVYLDAVLHPRAKTDPLVLQQEGWHYELEKPDEPLIYKGVVFNEMKGVYSSPESLLYRAAQRAVFPDNTYACDSGGDPMDITTLTFDGFKAFHDAYYHPSNARIFFYGDDELSKRLEFLDSYLSEFEAPSTPADSAIATQKFKGEPWKVVETFPAQGGGEEKHMVMVNWLLNEAPLTAEEEITLVVLDHLLMGTTTAALYKPVMESGLGEAVLGGGVSDELKQATFSVGLKGVAKDKVGDVETLVLETLEKVASDGFDAEAVEASLNTIEFQLRECNTGGFPKGLSFMLSVMPRWLYAEGGDDANPMDALRFEEPLAALKARLAMGEKVFESMLNRVLVDNRHRATVEMQPDATLAERMTAEETERLAEAKAAMAPEEVAKVIEETAALKRAQLAEDSEEQLASIPKVGLADLEREVKTVPTVESAIAGGGTLLTHPIPSGGVVYADLALDLSSVPFSELPLLNLLTRLMLEAGTSSLDAVALQRAIGARTGGISAQTIFQNVNAADGAIADPWALDARLLVRAKGTLEKRQELFDLIYAVLADANLDAQPKVVEILREEKSQMESAFVSAGHSFAGLRLGARNSLLGLVNEKVGGVSFYQTLTELLTEATDDWPALLARLQKVRNTILTREGIVINLTSDAAALEEALPVAEAFAAKLPEKPQNGFDTCSPWKEAVELLPRVDEGFAITTQVNYVAAGCQLVEAGKSLRMGALNVVSRFLSRGYLWDNVRVVGGAYGGGCALNPITGAFAFSSYRDPNLQNTLDLYGGAAATLEMLELTDEALEQAIVGAVGDLDGPLTADQKGFRALNWYLTKLTTEERQRFRDETIGCTRDDFALMAGLLKDASLKVAVFASEEAFAKANEARADDAQIGVTKL